MSIKTKFAALALATLAVTGTIAIHHPGAGQAARLGHWSRPRRRRALSAPRSPLQATTVTTTTAIAAAAGFASSTLSAITSAASVPAVTDFLRLTWSLFEKRILQASHFKRTPETLLLVGFLHATRPPLENATWFCLAPGLLKTCRGSASGTGLSPVPKTRPARLSRRVSPRHDEPPSYPVKTSGNVAATSRNGAI